VVEGPARLEQLDVVGLPPDGEHVVPGGVLRRGLEGEAHGPPADLRLERQGRYFGADSSDREGGAVRVRVDPDKCQGHNRCYSLAPELFDVDDFGYATASGDGVVPDQLEEKARLAAANCPEFAVMIEETNR
jgi:ferredoxin